MPSTASLARRCTRRTLPAPSTRTTAMCSSATRTTVSGRLASRPPRPILFPIASPVSGKLAKTTSPSRFGFWFLICCDRFEVWSIRNRIVNYLRLWFGFWFWNCLLRVRQTKITVCEAREEAGFADGDVLIFPDMIKYKYAKIYHRLISFFFWIGDSLCFS